MTPTWEIREGDCRDVLAEMDALSVQTVVTSPPYFGLRDYGDDAQIGLEATPDEFVAAMVEVFREVRRVLRDDGTVWLVLGDSFWTAKGAPGGATAGHVDGRQKARRFGCRPLDRIPPPGIKAKDLVGVPWRVALALQADGWWLRGDVIWRKPNAMPEPTAHDRPARQHEYVFLLSKSRNYRCEGKGLKSVWDIATRPGAVKHIAAFPPALVEPCIVASTSPGDVVLDPFSGSGTTGDVALGLGRSFVGVELNGEYAAASRDRLALTTTQETKP